MIEGALATFVGFSPRTPVGERCKILSDEGEYCNVRWITGSRRGRIDMVVTGLLAFDRSTKVSVFDVSDDEFGFEPQAPAPTRVACASVYASGGNEGLLRALDNDGEIDTIRSLARQAVAQLRERVAEDGTWQAVSSELGDQGRLFIDAAVREAVMSVLTERGDDVSHQEA